MESILARSAYCSGRCALTGKARRRKHVCSSPAMQSAPPSSSSVHRAALTRPSLPPSLAAPCPLAILRITVDLPNPGKWIRRERLLGGPMSLMTRKNTGAAAKERALDTATQVPVMARSAGQTARTAGLAARQSAEDAVAWAAPRGQEARSWAAPHVEQAGVAVREKIGPAISEKIAPTISSALV